MSKRLMSVLTVISFTCRSCRLYFTFSRLLTGRKLYRNHARLATRGAGAGGSPGRPGYATATPITDADMVAPAPNDLSTSRRTDGRPAHQHPDPRRRDEGRQRRRHPLRPPL